MEPGKRIYKGRYTLNIADGSFTGGGINNKINGLSGIGKEDVRGYIGEKSPFSGIELYRVCI